MAIFWVHSCVSKCKVSKKGSHVMYWLFLCGVVYHYENQLLVCFIIVLLDSLSIYNLHANYLCGITVRSA